jgi:toxin ParE1/3/4
VRRGFTVVWTPTAEGDVSAILDYIAHHESADRALAAYERLRRGIDPLVLFPLRGRVVPELQAVGLHEYREVVVGPYRVCFRVIGRRVLLLGVLDGRRDLAELLIDRAIRSSRET